MFCSVSALYSSKEKEKKLYCEEIYTKLPEINLVLSLNWEFNILILTWFNLRLLNLQT